MNQISEELTKEQLLIVVNQLNQVVNKQSETIKTYEGYFKEKKINLNIKCCEIGKTFYIMWNQIASRKQLYDQMLFAGFACHFLNNPLIIHKLCKECVNLLNLLDSDFHRLKGEIAKTQKTAKNNQEITMSITSDQPLIDLPPELATKLWKRMNGEQRMTVFKKMIEETAEKNKKKDGSKV